MRYLIRLIAVLIGAMAAAILLDPAKADEWHGEDKQLHLLAGWGIANAATLQTASPLQGFAWGCGAGAAKELFDMTGQGDPSVKDFVVTCLGAGLGSGTGWLLLPAERRGAQVLYRKEF